MTPEELRDIRARDAADHRYFDIVHPEQVPFVHTDRRALLAEVDRLTDNPEWDATEGAHPAWWRGCDHGVAAERARIRAAVEGLPSQRWTFTTGINGTSYGPDFITVDRASVLATIDGGDGDAPA